MNPSTVREALIVEAIGEVARLIDRVQAMATSVDSTRQALEQAGANLGIQLLAFEHRMSAISENAKVQAVKHIARRADEVARNSLDTQTRAMEQAARALLSIEVGPTQQRLTLPLQYLADRVDRPWEAWLTHAATAAVASAATWLLTGYLRLG